LIGDQVAGPSPRPEPRRVVIRVHGLAAGCGCLRADGAVAILRSRDAVEWVPSLCGPECECELVAVD